MKANWMFFRNSWTSCRKAQEFLDANNIQVDSRTDARKEKLDPIEVWERIKAAQSIHIAKGKKVDVFNPNVDSQDAILEAIMGRSGNLRAPTLQIGDTFFVGFNALLYDAISTAWTLRDMGSQGKQLLTKWLIWKEGAKHTEKPSFAEKTRFLLHYSLTWENKIEYAGNNCIIRSTWIPEILW